MKAWTPCGCGLCRACKARTKRSATRPTPSKCCELCGGPAGGRWNKMHWDHKHGSSTFRGWLCNQCNQALGLAGDNPALLRRMADYLMERGHTVTRPVIR